MDNQLKIAIKAAVEAGQEIIKVYERDFEVYTKEDQSPLTEADQLSNNIINGYLKQTDFPIISEENRQLSYAERKDWKTCWIVDPLDGTKEFIKKNGEFTVNIALCSGGQPIFGVIYVPVSGELYYADVLERTAFKTVLSNHELHMDQLFSDKEKISPEKPVNNTLKVVGSRSHMNQDTQDFIALKEKSFDNVEIVSKGSSLKFCMVAEGKAHIYPRYAPTMEWDTAAGQAICEAVGLEVISQQTQSHLRYNKEDLLNPYFLVQHP